MNYFKTLTKSVLLVFGLAFSLHVFSATSGAVTGSATVSSDVTSAGASIAGTSRPGGSSNDGAGGPAAPTKPGFLCSVGHWGIQDGMTKCVLSTPYAVANMGTDSVINVLFSLPAPANPQVFPIVRLTSDHGTSLRVDLFDATGGTSYATAPCFLSLTNRTCSMGSATGPGASAHLDITPQLMDITSKPQYANYLVGIATGVMGVGSVGYSYADSYYVITAVMNNAGAVNIYAAGMFAQDLSSQNGALVGPILGYLSIDPSTFTSTPGVIQQTMTGWFSGTSSPVIQEPGCAAALRAMPRGVCKFPFPATLGGYSITVDTNTSGYTGSSTGTCTRGSWVFDATPTCAITPQPDCKITIVNSPDGNCSFTFPAVKNSIAISNVQNTNTKNGYVGNISGYCSNGAWQTIGATCMSKQLLPCPSTSASNGACAYNIAGAPSGQSSTGQNMSPGYSGSLELLCSSGVWSTTKTTCVPNPTYCNASTTNLQGSNGTCSFDLPLTLSGVNSTVLTKTAGRTGSITGSCSNTQWTFSAGSCQ